MSEIAICMKVFGLATDGNGNKDYAGMKLNMGEFRPGHEIPYEELVSKVSKEELLKITGFYKMFKPEDIEIITPEEYERDYGDDEDGDAP